MMINSLDIMAKTLWGESRNQPIDGQVAVAHTIYNRYKAKSWYGDSIKDVCLKEWQFSCWNEDDPNRDKMENLSLVDPNYLQMIGICYLVIHNTIPDPTEGSTHYHTKSISPKWAEGETPCVEIGDHLFYNTVT